MPDKPDATHSRNSHEPVARTSNLIGQSLLVGLFAALFALLLWATTQEVSVEFSLLAAPRDTPTELYYASPKAPFDQRRRHAWAIDGDGWTDFSWQYRGPLHINSVRIDPIRSAGEIHLGSVRITGPAEERYLQGPELLDHMHGLNHLEVRDVSASTLHLASVGVDPHFSVEVPRPSFGPLVARFLAIFTLAAVLWLIIVRAARPVVHAWLSKRPEVEFLGIDNRTHIVAFLPTLISGVILTLFVLLLSATAWRYGFWRHDAWGYRADGLREFHESARWLAFLLHGAMKHIPHLMAWYAALFSFALFAFLFLRRFLAGTGAPLALILVLTLAAVIQPGLMSQLNWPIHSLATFFPLAIFALLTSKRSSLFVVFIATFLLFPILQSYAFLALLFGLPSYAQLVLLSPWRLFLRLTTLVAVWLGSIGFAHGTGRLAQLHYFGEIPAMPRWRAPNPAGDTVELLLNLHYNTQVYWEHVSQSYSTTFIALLGAMFALVFIAKAVAGPGSRALHFAILIGIAALLSFSVYLFTSPVGTHMPFRTSGTLGVALAFSLALLFIGAGALFPNPLLRANVLAIFILLLTIKPFALAHANMQWFATTTSDISGALIEIADRLPTLVSGVVIGTSHSPLWPPDRFRHLGTQPLVFEPIDSRQRITPAFIELGYSVLSWCTDTGELAPEPCQRFNELDFASCSSKNPQLCSGGYSDNGLWFVRF